MPIYTTETLELRLNKLPLKARRAFRVPPIPHNLVAVLELVDAGCSVHIHLWGFDIDCEGEIIYKGWRGCGSRLFRMILENEGGNRLTLPPDPDEYDASSGTIYQTMNWSVNNIYECENKDQLIKYYHASLCSYPKRTLAAAAKAGYLKGFPGIDATTINRHIGAEDATEMGHMRQLPSGTRSMKKTSKRRRPAQAIHILERDAASDDSIATLTQEPSNEKTRKVYMSVNLADGWIASDQTGAFPRVSTRGNEYICVFYIHYTNFIKGIAIKLQHRSELLGAYEKIYQWCESRGFKPTLHRMDNETSQDVEEFIKSQQAKIQYTAPGKHCAPAERAVLTFKSCFKSTLASLLLGFPICNRETK